MDQNKETISLIEKRVQEMKEAKLSEDFLDFKKLGQIKLFLDKKPKFVLMYIDIGDERVYVGSESL